MGSEKAVAKRSPQDTITAIVAAAGKEFGERGLEGARMENIARRCGRTKQLIYHYYGSKQALFADVVSRNHQRAIAELLCHDYEGLAPVEAFQTFLLNISDQYRRFPEWAPMMLDENLQRGIHYSERRGLRAVTQPLLARFRRILERGAVSGDFNPDIDADKFFAASFSLVTTCFMTGRVMSEYLSCDMRTDAGIEAWHHYATGMLLAAIRPVGAAAKR